MDGCMDGWNIGDNVENKVDGLYFCISYIIIDWLIHNHTTTTTTTTTTTIIIIIITTSYFKTIILPWITSYNIYTVD